jgi:actin-related protein 6
MRIFQISIRIHPKKNSIVQEYVLPDLTKSKTGRIRQQDDIPLDTDQVVVMGNERFSVPEILFRPDNIGSLRPHLLVSFSQRIMPGLEQAGLAETITASISLLPDDIQGMFWANIGLIGGTTKIPGFRKRL